MAERTLDLDLELLSAFSFYATILLAKTLLMAVLTGRSRASKGVFSNPEDLAHPLTKEPKIKFDDPDVERVRRAHLNDLENVVPFVLLGFIYVLTSPSVWMATWHFRLFAAARLCHTIVYLGQVPQPARAVSFLVGYLVCFSMIVQILVKSV